MATPQSERLALTPKTPATIVKIPYSASGSSGGRVLRTPLSDEAIWKRLKDAGFDEESVKRRDKAALIGYIAKLEAEIYDLQHHMGLLLFERKEWDVKCDQIKATADTAELTYKQEQAARASDMAKAKKREDALKKALGIEKECVCNIEKALHEMRAESAEAKVAAECKLAEARSMMDDSQKKFTEAEVKLHTAESLEVEASRYHRTAERKLREVEEREDDLRRRIISFKSDCDAKENEIQLERQSLRERQKVLQQSQDRLLDGQALLNQREEYIFSRSQEINRLEKELEASKSALEDEHKALNEEKRNLELMATSLSAREEAVISKESELNKKGEELLVLQGKLASKEFDGIQQAIANHEAEVNSKTSTFEAELQTKLKLVEEEIETKRRDWEFREIDMKQKEELVLEKEHDLEIRSRGMVEKEKDLVERSHALEEKEKSLIAAEEKVELKNSLLQKEKEEFNRMKLDLCNTLECMEEKKRQINSAEEKVEAKKSETNELLVLETRLKEEIDIIRTQKLELESEADQLKAEKAKFETEWELIDEKREELRKAGECVKEERLAIDRFLKDERDSLRLEKDAMRNQYRLDLESLSRDREAFMSEMEHERSELFSKIQKERADFLLDIAMQKEELENCFDKRREEIETYLKERERAFDEEKKKELQQISSLRETVAKEMELVNFEMKKLETERKEINLDREKRDKEWAELNTSIEELKLQRQKLEKQRELLHGDRDEILSQIAELKKLEDLKHIPDRIAPTKVLQAARWSNSSKRLLEHKNEIDSGQKGDVLNGIKHNLSSSKGSDTPSPLSAPLSWLKRYADTLLDQTQSSKKRRREKDADTPSEILLHSCSQFATTANAQGTEDAATPIHRTSVGAEETTVYMDRMITTREVTSESVLEEGDKKLENNGDIRMKENRKLETKA